MTESEAIAYIESYGWSAVRLGLDRTRQLVHELMDPQKKLKFIHVAGSNGKGSTCAMFASILRKAGFKTGLYTSPYIETFNERIQINGIPISGDRLASVTEKVRDIADKMEDHPSQFELVTAIAIQYFYEEECDIVVFEVGMGGALDSTNVIDAPELAVLTNIGLEHTEYLGSTLEEIALTKAGIIKAGCSCICYDGADKVNETIEKVCREKRVPLRISDFSKLRLIDSTIDGQRFSWDDEEYYLSLIGPHQLHNAALVLTGIEVLRERGFNIPEASVHDGLSEVIWPARLEVLSKTPLFILDGGHNPQCARALADSLGLLLNGQKSVFLMGVLADKNYEEMIDSVIPYASLFVCVTVDSSRALKASDLSRCIEERGFTAVTCDTVFEGIDKALKLSKGTEPVVAFGSLYMAGAIRYGLNKLLQSNDQ
ncbi:MAG: bifunctional folylpolyglutamate synthase/dihydrofolate synthase [Lachnospiraceae bacterium]|nr:bifunctional folylpolyglutamate synthase/dihydrofolate synthase [Lachnospiraceae bacterium]